MNLLSNNSNPPLTCNIIIVSLSTFRHRHSQCWLGQEERAAGALDSEAEAEPGVAGDKQLRQLDHEVMAIRMCQMSAFFICAF